MKKRPWRMAGRGGGSIFLVVTAAVLWQSEIAGADTAPLAGLVAAWRGEGNANEVLGEHDGTPGAGVSYTTGKYGQGFSFDGTSNGYLDVSSPEPLFLYGRGTVCMWVKVGNPTLGETRLFSAGDKDSVPSPYYTTWWFEHRGTTSWVGGGIQDGLVDGDNLVFSQATTAGSWTNVNWRHLAVVCSAGGDTEIYIDGVSQGFTGDNYYPGDYFFNAIPGADNIKIGAVARAGGIVGEGAKVIDEVYIYNRALSSSEVAAVMNADEGVVLPPRAASREGLVAYWGAEGDGSDPIGGHNGTLGGGASFSSGRYGQGFYLDGTSTGYVEVGNADTLLALGQGTVALWLAPQDMVTSDQRVVHASDRDVDPPNHSEWAIGYRGTAGGFDIPGHIQAVAVDQGSLLFGRWTAGNIIDRGFHHVAVVARGLGEGHDVDVYLDGVKLNFWDYFFDDEGDYFFDDLTGADTIMLGAVRRLSYIDGAGNKYIDEVYIYEQPLTSNDVLRVMHAAKGPEAPGGIVFFIR